MKKYAFLALVLIFSLALSKSAVSQEENAILLGSECHLFGQSAKLDYQPDGKVLLLEGTVGGLICGTLIIKASDRGVIKDSSFFLEDIGSVTIVPQQPKGSRLLGFYATVGADWGEYELYVSPSVKEHLDRLQ